MAPSPHPAETLPAWVRIGLRVWIKGWQSALAIARPWFDLLLRLALALPLLRSGLVKASDWDTALALATLEYPVPFMAPPLAALVGVLVELVAGSLIALGLLTRGSALAVMTLTVTAHLYHVPVDGNLWAIAAALWLFVQGAGAISLDRALAPGLAGSPLPLAMLIVRLGDLLTRRAAPVMLALLRLWLAVALLVAAGSMAQPVALPLFPAGTFALLPAALLVALAVLLASGLATPLAAILLAVPVGGMQVMGMHPGPVALSALVALIPLFYGPGRLAFDVAIGDWLQRRVLFDRRSVPVPAHWPHVVVIGGGFGGIACVGKLRRLPVRITLIDRNNYHLFQPLLYQIATAGLSPADVATPIRSLFRDDGNVRVLLDEVTGVDRAARRVQHRAGETGFDYCVIATGASHSYFGKDQWAPFAPGLKRIEDAVAVRAEVLRAFELAEGLDDREHIRRLLTFVIVGAGPTGVELAGAIAELARFGLRDEYRAIDPAQARVILIQSGPRILPAFPEDLSAHAAAALERLGVELMLDARVTDIAADHVMIGERRIDSETVLWAAGVVASPAARWLGCETDSAGRAIVAPDCSIPGSPEVFVIGDTAASTAWAGKPVPGLAPAAKQGGEYVARLIRARLEGKAVAPFAYRHQGSLATIGRKAAVADFGRIRLHGALAWWLWGVVHVGFLAGLRNRASVLVNWVWSYFTLKQGIRLITSQR